MAQGWPVNVYIRGEARGLLVEGDTIILPDGGYTPFDEEWQPAALIGSVPSRFRVVARETERTLPLSALADEWTPLSRMQWQMAADYKISPVIGAAAGWALWQAEVGCVMAPCPDVAGVGDVNALVAKLKPKAQSRWHRQVCVRFAICRAKEAFAHVAVNPHTPLYREYITKMIAAVDSWIDDGSTLKIDELKLKYGSWHDVYAKTFLARYQYAHFVFECLSNAVNAVYAGPGDAGQDAAAASVLCDRLVRPLTLSGAEHRFLKATLLAQLI